MIPACRLLPLRANWLANIIAGGIMTLVNGFLTFVLPLTNGDFGDPVFPAYVFFATIETVCTSVIIWQAWTWSGVADCPHVVTSRSKNEVNGGMRPPPVHSRTPLGETGHTVPFPYTCRRPQAV